jgi:hypothetical protein
MVVVDSIRRNEIYTVRVFSEVLLDKIKKDFSENDIAYHERIISNSSFPFIRKDKVR